MNLLTKAAFAKKVGVVATTISAQTAPGKKLAAAMVGTKIDADHPNAVHYARTPRKKPRHNAHTPGIANPIVGEDYTSVAPELPPDIDESRIPEDLSELYEKPLREIIDIYGSIPALLDWLKAGKLLEEIKTKQLKNAKDMGELVPREFFEKNILNYIVTANARLLNDSPRTIALSVQALVEAGAPLSELTAEIQKGISSQIRSVKAKVIGELDEL